MWLLTKDSAINFERVSCVWCQEWSKADQPDVARFALMARVDENNCPTIAEVDSNVHAALLTNDILGHWRTLEQVYIVEPRVSEMRIVAMEIKPDGQ